mgnify:CR=1 FL=1
MDSDLEDIRYLYYFGEYITEEELETAKHLNGMRPEEIRRMADTYTEGYRIGFEVYEKDISKKKTVNILYCLGFERMIRAAVENFAKMGLSPAICRFFFESLKSLFHYFQSAVGILSVQIQRLILFMIILILPVGDSPVKPIFTNAFSPQDAFPCPVYGGTQSHFCKIFHRRPYHPFKPKAKEAFEALKEEAALLGGPAVVEVFGEEPFVPEVKEEALKLSVSCHR